MNQEESITARVDQFGQMRYIVITPVRNEAKFIEKTIRSMIEQTARPTAWIIVNDGSSDETPDIVARYTAHHSWIKLINRQDRGFRQRGAGVVEAFYEGFDQITDTTYKVVVKLDGDLSFEPGYFEGLLKLFAANPRLGIASGQPYVFDGNKWVKETPLIPCTYGPTKLYRRECFEAIGGIPRSLGWDGIDDWKAQLLGWQIASFDSLRVLHHRDYGAATGALKSRIEQGRGAYFMRYHPLYMLARGIKRMANKPWVVGGLMMLWGYLLAGLTGSERINDPELIDYLRRTQMSVLMARLLPWQASPQHAAVGNQTDGPS